MVRIKPIHAPRLRHYLQLNPHLLSIFGVAVVCVIHGALILAHKPVVSWLIQVS